MPNITLPDGRRSYVNPFSVLCDCCEDRVPSDWIDARCRYECDRCQRDCESEHAGDAHEQFDDLEREIAIQLAAE